MRRQILFFCAASLGVLSALPSQAQNMKPGLWEIKQQPQLDPKQQAQMEQAQKQMAAMPPEQRKMMEEMMSKHGVSMGMSGGVITIKTCISKEQAERNTPPVTDQANKCKHDVQRSGSLIKMRFSCTEPPSEGESEMTLKSGGEGFTSKTRVTSQREGRSQTMTLNAEASWLGSDCGSIKPAASR